MAKDHELKQGFEWTLGSIAETPDHAPGLQLPAPAHASLGVPRGMIEFSFGRLKNVP